MKKKLIIGFYVFSIFLSAFLFINCRSTSFPVLGQNKIFQDNLYKDYMNLGNSYYDIEKFSEAIPFYKKVLNDKVLGKSAYYKIAQCYAHIADWGNALPMYEKILEEDPDNQAIKANVAYIYAMTGKVDKALEYYSGLLESQPNNIQYMENYLAVVLSDKDVFTENEGQWKIVFESLKENDPKNKNIESFQGKYDEYVKKPEEDEAGKEGNSQNKDDEADDNTDGNAVSGEKIEELETGVKETEVPGDNTEKINDMEESKA